MTLYLAAAVAQLEGRRGGHVPVAVLRLGGAGRPHTRVVGGVQVPEAAAAAALVDGVPFRRAREQGQPVQLRLQAVALRRPVAVGGAGGRRRRRRWRWRRCCRRSHRRVLRIATGPAAAKCESGGGDVAAAAAVAQRELAGTQSARARFPLSSPCIAAAAVETTVAAAPGPIQGHCGGGCVAAAAAILDIRLSKSRPGT